VRGQRLRAGAGSRSLQASMTKRANNQPEARRTWRKGKPGKNVSKPLRYRLPAEWLGTLDENTPAHVRRIILEQQEGKATRTPIR